MSLLVHENPFEQIVAELTTRLRADTVRRHLGAPGRELAAPLEMFLEAFATRHVHGMLGAFWYLKQDSFVPRVQLAEEDCDPFRAFIWPPMIAAMMLHGLRSEGPVSPGVVSGLACVTDRATVLAYEPWWIAEEDARILPQLFDVIGSAYAIGVALSSAGPGLVSDSPVADLARRVAGLPTEYRVLLEARYGREESADDVARAHHIPPREWPLRISSAIDHARCGLRASPLATEAS
ncbi:MAG: hypothetical protein U0414_21900 [Polyangiaceae bacterium]